MAKSPFLDLRNMMSPAGATVATTATLAPGECLRAALANAQRRTCEEALLRGDLELQLREAFGAEEVGHA